MSRHKFATAWIGGMFSVCLAVGVSQVTEAHAQAVIVQSKTGKCLDVPDGSKATHAIVQQFQCNGGPSQRWFYRNGAIINQNSGLCLDIPDADASDHMPLQQFPCHGGANQRWTMGSAGEIRNVATGKCLDVPDGISDDHLFIQQFRCHGGPNQRWSGAFFGAPAPAESVATSPAAAAPSDAQSSDDNENSAPTRWWIYTGQSFDDIRATIARENARIVDIAADNPSMSAFTVTYVQNTGAYAKRWWWYVGVDADALSKAIDANHGRLIALKAYDVGGGAIRFAAAMVENSGADAKGWWWYWGQSMAQVGALANQNKARITKVQSYTSNGETFYAVVMIANEGTDAKGWWWWVNVDPQRIEQTIARNSARVLDLTPAGNGRLNAALEACSQNCPSWWWYHGLDAGATLRNAQANGARIIAANRYPGCGPAGCFTSVMIGN